MTIRVRKAKQNLNTISLLNQVPTRLAELLETVEKVLGDKKMKTCFEVTASRLKK